MLSCILFRSQAYNARYERGLPMIEGIGISKRFGNLTLFDKFDFHIDTGEFVCFSGKSGCGKTTLLNMIGLIEEPDDGIIMIDGNKYRNNKEKLLFYRQKVGFLFQNYALIESKSVLENLELIRSSDRTENSVEEVLRKVGLENKINNKIYTLSGGEQQRVAIARLLLKKCDIVLADEPTGSLDKENAEAVMNQILLLNKSGKTIVLVTHDSSIKEKAHRVIEI